MLGQSNPTPFDVRFWLGNIPVRVHPLFWIISVVMGWGACMPGRPDLLVMWVLCLFVSILVHEMGHAVMARAYGYQPEIVLHGFGGYASYFPTHWCGTARAVMISFAGPAAGFLLLASIVAISIFLARLQLLPRNDIVEFALSQMIFINLWWGLVNLLPVLPLDGGRISEHLWEHFRPADAFVWTRRISLVVAFGVSFYFFRIDRSYAAFLFLMLGVQNLQELQGSRYR
jgi:Zn-dependent protease